MSVTFSIKIDRSLGDLKEKTKKSLELLLNKNQEKIKKDLKSILKARLSSGVHHKSLPYPSSISGFPPNEQFGRLGKSFFISKSKSSNSMFSTLYQNEDKGISGNNLSGFKRSVKKIKVVYAEILEFKMNRPFFFKTKDKYLKKNVKKIEKEIVKIISRG